MSVYQVDEYYIYLTELTITPEKRREITDMLAEECFTDYEYQDNETVLIVNDIPDEAEGEALEEKILEILAD